MQYLSYLLSIKNEFSFTIQERQKDSNAVTSIQKIIR